MYRLLRTTSQEESRVGWARCYLCVCVCVCVIRPAAGWGDLGYTALYYIFCNATGVRGSRTGGKSTHEVFLAHTSQSFTWSFVLRALDAGFSRGHLPDLQRLSHLLYTHRFIRIYEIGLTLASLFSCCKLTTLSIPQQTMSRKLCPIICIASRPNGGSPRLSRRTARRAQVAAACS